MVFNIGDIIKVKESKDIPPELRVKSADGNPHLWSNRKRINCGKIGIITDVVYSKVYECELYRLRFDGEKQESQCLYDGDNILPYEEFKTIVTYDYDIQFLQGVVLVIMYKVEKQGEQIQQKTEIARGHGHIIHEGDKGIAQATSYALKKIYEKLNGGTI